MELGFFWTYINELNQSTLPKQDSSENVISSTLIAKLKNKGTWKGNKNYESGSDGRDAWQSEDCKKI